MWFSKQLELVKVNKIIKQNKNQVKSLVLGKIKEKLSKFKICPWFLKIL